MTVADLIITNARILTMDPAYPCAEAIAIAGNRICSIGSNADVLGLKAQHTKTIDAAKNTVMPGIVESHMHLFGGAVELLLDSDIEVTAAGEIAAIKPSVTICDGRITYEA